MSLASTGRWPFWSIAAAVLARADVTVILGHTASIAGREAYVTFELAAVTCGRAR